MASLDRSREALGRTLEAYRKEPSGDPLHDLRVALRRAAALARLFRGFPAARSGKVVRVRVQDLRRRLSCARQHEVSRQLLTELAKDGEEGASKVITAWPAEPKGTPALADVLRDGRAALRLLTIWRVKAAAWRPPGAERRRLAHKVTKRARRARKRVLELGVPDRETLHAQRIAGKALRYRLELLKGFEPRAEALVKASRKLQDALGVAHDWACLVTDVAAKARTMPLAARGAMPRLLRRVDAERARHLGLAQKAARRFVTFLSAARPTVRQKPIR